MQWPRRAKRSSHDRRHRLSRQEGDGRTHGQNAARGRRGALHGGPAVHFHLRLGKPGLYRLPSADLVSARAHDAGRLRHRHHHARGRVRAVRRGRRRRDRRHSVRGWMADRLGLPMLYVRKKPKGFGRNSQIEGHLVEGQRVLLVEDMTSDGRSKVNFCTALRQAGAKVEHALVFFFYDIFPEARKILSDLGVTLHSLATWWDVLAVAKESGKFDAA